MELVEGKIEGEKVFRGVVFQKTLNPPKGESEYYGVNEFVEMVKEKRDVWIVEAFWWEEIEYVGPISRSKVADRVYIANEAPSICLSTSTMRWPWLRDNNCDYYIVVEKMEQKLLEIMAKLSELGFAIEMLSCGSFNFNKDGSAKIVYGPMSPIKEFGGRKVWFYTILGYSSKGKRGISALGMENCVDLKWQKGDILLVDNLTVQHARHPGKPPCSILVSVCK
ncbi:hypothetical protein NE237_018186 [Protea cynaroides]|uniref:TauD/TfdA-like domain-containing protein n=1 Tax=Protea cynaroides TaxID=273540 RepID=A0A9Q0K9H3_9MAGN|nr:hypothetical protein NE237_018186 [Protea cynaroides]